MIALLQNIYDEIWISILNEWIGSCKALAALDLAICNRVLRHKYLHWLTMSASTECKINFEGPYDKKNASKGLRKAFFTWCEQRHFFPRTVSLFSASYAHLLPPEHVKAMSHLHDLSLDLTKYGEVNGGRPLSLPTLLNMLPELQTIRVIGSMIIRLPHPELEKPITLQNPSYSLRSLEIAQIPFFPALSEWAACLGACPQLTVLRMKHCSFTLDHLVYALNHAIQLIEVEYVASELLLLAEHHETMQTDNTTVKTLHLRSSRSMAPQIQRVLDILGHCKGIETLSLVQLDRVPVLCVGLEETVITAGWSHTLHNLTTNILWTATNRMTLLDLLCEHCAASLETLQVTLFAENTSYRRLWQGLIALQTLHVHFDLSLPAVELALTDLFAASTMQSTLKHLSLFVNEMDESALPRYLDGLKHFTALQSLRFLAPTKHSIRLQVEIIDYFSGKYPLPLAEQLEALEVAVAKQSARTSLLPSSNGLSLARYHRLQRLVLTEICLTDDGFQGILQLPYLHYLQIGYHQTLPRIELFDTVPLEEAEAEAKRSSTPLLVSALPLKELHLVQANNIRYTMHSLRAFLRYKAIALTALHLGNQWLDREEVQQLRHEVFFRLELFTPAH